jgi:hypothetical protein
VRLLRAVPEITNVVVGVEDDGDDFLPAEAEKGAEVIAIALLEFGASHIGRVVSGMTVVVFQHMQDIVEPCAGNKDQAFPMMNHPVGAGDFATVD